MNKYFISVCLFGLVACEGVVPAKPDNKEAKPPVKEITYPIKKSPEPKQPIRKVKKSSVKNIPYIYGDMLYFWKTPQEVQKYSTPYKSSKEVNSYFISLNQALIKRNPENDAKAFLAKKQRFLLGEFSGAVGGRTRLRTNRGLATKLFQGIDPDAIRKCRSTSVKRLQNDDLLLYECLTDIRAPICRQYLNTMKKYRFRWNRAMLKDCEKH